ncbi:LIM domain-containing protein PLIM2c-like isoform X1 [Lycium barbarum]|uniref:LIM domain-containing protein PLIM2c-like isoform X1 n=1 Tax=Lycium barbarum TaxID=112863 RepID=UPI00293E8743|nr:LIM domain-containing protein PLIM2c-like isoform X1 [Lycium barbarum]XP_060214309.1 LIM domain-containing protein PLIM2c-like isoform X1 [Lycium barbarum]
MSNYSSMDGILYCKTHFEQLFKESGNFSKNFQNPAKSERQNSLIRAPSKLSAMFSGTQEKCAACDKTVYPLEKPSDAASGSLSPMDARRSCGDSNPSDNR